MGARVAVARAIGYAGGELLRLLAAHPDIEIGAIAPGSSEGRPTKRCGWGSAQDWCSCVTPGYVEW